MSHFSMESIPLPSPLTPLSDLISRTIDPPEEARIKEAWTNPPGHSGQRWSWAKGLGTGLYMCRWLG